MRQITIPQFSITTTRVGFGCSSLVGMVSSSEARALIDAAYDAGIRHFDVARSYGQGAAESVLGRALGRRRSQVTITSKFGLPVPGRRLIIDVARAMLRPVAKRIRGVKARPHSTVQTLEFNRRNAEESLNISLRELRTDYLDIFLLHEASAQALSHPELLAFLEEAQQAGKIRGYGVGSDLLLLPELVSTKSEYCPIVQHQWSPLTGEVPIPLSSFRITHGALASAFGKVRERLRSDAELTRRLSEAADVDLTSETNLSALLLQSAALKFPDSITLFSARSTRRIEANAAALSEISAGAGPADFLLR